MSMYHIMKINNVLRGLLTVCCLLIGMASSGGWAATITDVEYASLPGGATELRLIFDGTPPEPRSYTIEKPARIAMDLQGVRSNLGSKYHNIDSGSIRSLTVIQASAITRVIVNLTDLVGYETQVDGNELKVLIGGAKPVAAAEPALAQSTQPQPASASSSKATVTDIDFRRGGAGEGQVIIEMTDPNIGVDIIEQGRKIRVEFDGLHLPETLQRRLDVTDFATPVHIIDAYTEAGNTVMIIEPQGDQLYDYLAYQTDNKLTINVKPLTDTESKKRNRDKFPYTGEKLSLNFQDIEVRAVLQLIADFTELNLVASDSVGGGITLRLQNVPWDQALDLVLKTKGLGKRQVGNVLLVAPAEELAARERLELEASKQVAQLAPLRTEFIQVRYAKADEVVTLLTSEQGLLSERGRASVDERTNTLIIQDTSEKLQAIRDALTILDVPVRQVLIEARIVIARTNLGEELGVRWGGAGFNANADRLTRIGGSIDTIGDLNNDLVDGETPTVEFPDALVVDLGVQNAAASSLAVGFSAADYLIDLELSALETDGKAEIVSQPKVITADGQTARIESGTEIPFQRATSSGATSVEFKSAVLSLEVTPQITPDDRIIMDLKVNQDSVGELTEAGPSIDTNEVTTQVLVENGETIVLGGIFRTEEVRAVTKTPFLGDLPLIGALFRRTSYTDLKSELLVFITPRLVEDTLSIR